MSNFEYSLDVALDSSAQAEDPEQPIALAYGYAELTPQSGGQWEPEGQRTLRVFQIDDNFYFGVFDTAAEPGELKELTVVFVNTGQTVPPSLPPSPFDWGGATKTFPGDQMQKTVPGHSVGCNVETPIGWITPVQVVTHSGDYVSTIHVTMQVNGLLKQFIVDPRMIVGGGG